MSTIYPSLYVHLPFCDVICHYCDFYTARAKEARHEELFGALKAHLRQIEAGLAPSLHSIYFGGGTPSVTPPELLHDFLAELKSRIGTETEVTLEANPRDVTLPNLKAWRGAGVNRVSIGVQSLEPALLKSLGRTHGAEDALAAVALAAQEMPRVSADLIYAVPGQALNESAEAAERLVKAGAKHLSAYHLTLEPRHFLYGRLPTHDGAAAQLTELRDRLAGLGLAQYEVSNFGRPGEESRHNQVYWTGLPYQALGPSAHGFDGENKRWRLTSDWTDYCARISSGSPPAAEEEELNPSQRQIEVLFTSLRTRQGLDLLAFQKKFGVDLEQKGAQIWDDCEAAGLLIRREGRVIPSFSGLLLADEICTKIMQILG